MSIVGRLGIGWVSDFITRRVVLILAVLGQVGGILLFYYVHLSFLLIPFVILFSISYGGVIVLRPGVLRDYYGSTYIGSILGFCIGLSSIGGIFGPLVAGWIFDTTSSYSLAWVITGSMLLLGVPLLLVMKDLPAAKKHE